MKAFGPTRRVRAAVIATTLFGASICNFANPGARADRRYRRGLGDLSARIIAAEGGPGRNPLSSAAGYGQFLSGDVAREMFERAYPQVAQTMTREQILALRDIKPIAEDPDQPRYARDNAATLRSVGLPVSEGELSLAHAIGPRGAVSVLTAEPARPAAELLRPETIVANPVLREMTASTLRQWAAIRVKAPAERSLEGGAPKAQDADPSRSDLEMIFRVDERTKASEALAANHNASVVLQELVDALSRAGSGKGAQLGPSTAAWLLSVGIEPSELLNGEPAAVRIFDRAASRRLLDAIREVSDRDRRFGEFKPIEIRAAARGQLPRGVLRALAIALLDKMRQENATISKIVQHRRGRD